MFGIVLRLRSAVSILKFNWRPLFHSCRSHYEKYDGNYSDLLKWETSVLEGTSQQNVCSNSLLSVQDHWRVSCPMCDTNAVHFNRLFRCRPYDKCLSVFLLLPNPFPVNSMCSIFWLLYVEYIWQGGNCSGPCPNYHDSDHSIRRLVR